MTAVEFIEGCEQMASKEDYDELVAFYCNQQFCKDLVEMVNKPIPEISDVDIKKKRWEDWEEFNEIAGYSEDSASPYADGFTRGAKWYREQLKQRQ